MERIGQYQIERLIAQGGMGAVFLGRDPRFDRAVAVKVLHAHLRRDPGIVERFKAEAVIQAKLNHPHIVTVLDFVADDTTLAMVMEYVDGETLSQFIRDSDGPLALDRTVRLMDQVLAAVGFAHAKGLVHRDLKPSNILVQRFGEDEVAKVMDFGIAKILGSQKQKTAAAAKLGTLSYMSPEHVRSPKAVDGRADIYALGVVLFEMAAGRVPFDAETEYELMCRIVEEPPDLDLLGPAAALRGVVARALAKAPGDRYQTCAEMRVDLAAAATAAHRPPPPSTRPVPTPIPAAVEAPPPVAQPEREPEPAPQPEPTPEPELAPVPEAEPVPAPEPAPEAAPEPVPGLQPEPVAQMALAPPSVPADTFDLALDDQPVTIDEEFGAAEPAARLEKELEPVEPPSQLEEEFEAVATAEGPAQLAATAEAPRDFEWAPAKEQAGLDEDFEDDESHAAP